MKRRARCERNMAGREEDTSAGVAYTPCGKPATHMVYARSRDGRDEWAACDEHAAEAESDGCTVEKPHDLEESVANLPPGIFRSFMLRGTLTERAELQARRAKREGSR